MSRALVLRPWQELFLAKVNKEGGLPNLCPKLGQCWLWTAATDKNGYGRFSSRQIKMSSLAHVIMYKVILGKRIKIGLVLDHLCCVTSCVNPKHLEPVTNAENVRRIWARGRQAIVLLSETCVRGHIYTKENTYYDKRKHRVCRMCHRGYMREWKRKKVALAG